MGEMILCPEILEHILKFVDGETLLMCREVSDEFAAAVKYLSQTSNIWEECCLKENKNYPYSVISKFHPHSEGLNHPKNWGLIYETSLLSTFLRGSGRRNVSKCKIGKRYSNIEDVETHEDLLFVLVKYNKDYSIFYKIITINIKNEIIGKSCRFFANMLYVTPIEDSSSVRTDVISLSCDLCTLVAVPVCVDDGQKGFPKFDISNTFLTIEHSNSEYLWMNNFKKLFSKGKCFHTGKSTNPDEAISKDEQSLKVCQVFTELSISWGGTRRKFNTFLTLLGNVTASIHYSNVLILGTNTGMLFGYSLKNESDLEKLELQCYMWQFDVCFKSILLINVMELKNEFVIVCCSEKSVYRVHIERELKNF